MIRTVHPIAGGTALLVIASFWLGTVTTEVFGGPGSILAAKTAILYGLLLLVPAIAVAGATGFRLGGRSPHPLIRAKRARMPLIAANGLLVLVPAAVFLQNRAAAGDFGTSFLIVQGVELVAGAINVGLLTLSLRDGLRLKRRAATVTTPR